MDNKKKKIIIATAAPAVAALCIATYFGARHADQKAYEKFQDEVSNLHVDLDMDEYISERKETQETIDTIGTGSGLKVNIENIVKDIDAKLSIDGDEISIEYDGNTIKLSVGSTQLYINDELTEMDESVYMSDTGEIYAPIYDIGDALNYTISGEDEFDINIARPYQTKALIVTSKSEPNFSAGELIAKYKNTYIYKFDSETETKNAYNELSESDSVESVERDVLMMTNDIEEDSEEESEEDYSAEEEAKLTGMQESELKNYLSSIKTENEVIVAIIDSGLNIQDVSYADRVIDSELNLSSTGDADSVSDDNGHGTKMATIIAENTGENVKIMPIKVANAEGVAAVSNIYLGIKEAMNKGADVINISLNGYSSEQSAILQEIIDEATNKGVAVVVSAGNSNANTNYFSPANIDSAITVSATTKKYVLASFSNYGDSVDFTAINESGTSGAAAYVSAVVSILKSNEVAGKTDVEETLKEYAVDLGAEGKDKYYGNGLITLEDINYDEIDEYVGDQDYEGPDIMNLIDTWKEVSEEMLQDAISYSNDANLAYFLQSLSKEDLALLLSYDTMLNHTLKHTDENGEEVERLYYDSLLNMDISSFTTSDFTSKSGYTLLTISGANSKTSNLKVTYNFTASGTSWKDDSTGQPWTGDVIPTSGKTDYHNTTLAQVKSKTQYANTSSLSLALSASTAYKDVVGTTRYKSKLRAIMPFAITYDKPAYTYSETAYDTTTKHPDARANWKYYETGSGKEDDGWKNIGDETANSAGVNSSQVREKLYCQVHATNAGMEKRTTSTNSSGVWHTKYTITLKNPKVTVSYDKNGHTVASNASVNISTKTQTFTIDGSTKYDPVKFGSFGLSKTGYTMTVWNTKANGSGSSFSPTKEYYAHQYISLSKTATTYSVKLYAQSEINSSTLKINPNGGTYGGKTSTTSVTQDYNTTYAIATPTIAGFTVKFDSNGGSSVSNKTASRTFSSWTKTGTFYGTLNSNTKYTFPSNDGVTSTITANYKTSAITLPTSTKAYTVTFNGNGGTSSASSLKSNGTLNGWYSAASGGTKYGASGASYTATKDITMTAQWKMAAITLPTASKPGYTFLGWSTSSTATSATYSAGASYTPSANVTLYAVYAVYDNANANSGTLQVNPNGGKYGGKTTVTSATNSTGTVLTIADPVRDGYTFDGWRYSSLTGTFNASTKKYTYGKNYSSVDVLTALWEENTYIIKYDRNNSDAKGSMLDSLVNYTETFSLTKNAYSDDANKKYFIGWNTKADGTGTSYADEAEVSKLTSTNNGTVTLYAQWAEINVLGTVVSESGINGDLKYEENGTLTLTTSGYADSLTIVFPEDLRMVGEEGVETEEIILDNSNNKSVSTLSVTNLYEGKEKIAVIVLVTVTKENLSKTLEIPVTLNGTKPAGGNLITIIKEN